MDNYLVTIRGILNEHPEMASRVKAGINPATTLVKCECIEKRDFPDHVNLTLRVKKNILIHKYVMTNGKVVHPDYLAFESMDQAKEHFIAWHNKQQKSS